jgi:hypothetical protein
MRRNETKLPHHKTASRQEDKIQATTRQDNHKKKVRQDEDNHKTRSNVGQDKARQDADATTRCRRDKTNKIQGKSKHAPKQTKCGPTAEGAFTTVVEGALPTA